MTRADVEREHTRQRALEVSINGNMLLLVPKVFSTGSLGWHGQSKLVIADTKCQLNFTVTVIGSKPLPAVDSDVSRTDGGEVLAVGEQTDTAPKEAPVAPPEHSPLFGDVEPAKKPAIRSRR